MVVCLDRCVTGLIMACVDVCLIHFGSDLVRVAAAEFDPAVFKDAFYFVLVSPSPGGPGEGTDCHFPKGNREFWADSGPGPGEGPVCHVPLEIGGVGANSDPDPEGNLF